MFTFTAKNQLAMISIDQMKILFFSPPIVCLSYMVMSRGFYVI